MPERTKAEPTGDDDGEEHEIDQGRTQPQTGRAQEARDQTGLAVEEDAGGEDRRENKGRL